MTAAMPSRLAVIAMPSGDLEIRRAVAAGMMSREVMSRMPTMCSEVATTSVMTSMSRMFAHRVLTPSARARSSCMVMRVRSDHFHSSSASTTAPPPYDQ